ncbi:MAG: hypothetical protein O2829_07385 [Bacteroidetes bacterium]|nr:hypothetical protein [Bacteroidota bacterium]MDA1268900.1 hypothetical protein [Bacteroidota bacterium]
MKFLSSVLFLFFGLFFTASQPGISPPEATDFDKLQGLLSQIEAQMQILAAELEDITNYDGLLLQHRDSILATPMPFKYTMDGYFVLVNGNIIGGKSEDIELSGMPLLKNHV